VIAAASIPARLVRRLRYPKTTVRWRLTLLYGGLFLVSGAALLAITYTLVSHNTVTTPRAVVPFGFRVPAQISLALDAKPKPANAPVRQSAPAGGFGAALRGARKDLSAGPPGSRFETPVAHRLTGPLLSRVKQLLKTTPGEIVGAIIGGQQRVADLHSLVIESSIALAIMAVIAGALGWFVSGRVLAPLQTITATTQQISEASLHRRLAMDGPNDELHQLADTIDALLERLQGSFDAQRRFVANASHELRTPLTAARALLEMVLSDPNATIETYREICEQVLEEGEQQEQLIEALLALAQGQRGIDRREPADLAEIAADVLAAKRPVASDRGLRVDSSLVSAPLSGDRRLLERLVSNLVDNALRHNVAGGSVSVDVGVAAGQATLRVLNTGPVVPADEIERLLQPFQRLSPDRVGYRDGLGLGLSIVAAIAGAHDAALDVRPAAGGGLDVEVRFPRAAGAAAPTPAGWDAPGPDAPEPELEPAGH